MRVLFRYLVLMLLVFTLSSNVVFAHTTLESASPAEGETVATPLEKVEIHFAENIEPLSVLELENKSGETLKPTEILVSENVLIGTFTPPVPNGDYTVLWKIVGKDGHLIEGEYSFILNAPQPEVALNGPEESGEEASPTDPTEDSTSNTPNEENTVVEEAQPEGTLNEAEGNESVPQEGGAFWVWIAVFIVGVTLLSVFLRRPKRNARD